MARSRPNSSRRRRQKTRSKNEFHFLFKVWRKAPSESSGLFPCMSSVGRLFGAEVGAKADINALLITHYSLLITHDSLLITHYSRLITHYSLLITHDSLLPKRNARRSGRA